MEKKLFTPSYFKNCSIEGSLGNTKWFFNGIDVKKTLYFKKCMLSKTLAGLSTVHVGCFKGRCK